MNSNFKQIVDTKSVVVDSIIDKAMFHAHKEDARCFLRFMDNYLCYFLKRNSEGLCFPILRIPSCPDWAREVALKYLIYRISIYYNSDILEDLRPATVIHYQYEDPLDPWQAREARRENMYLSKWESYKRSISNLNKNHEYLGESGHKNLIFCSPSDLTVSRESKNRFIQEFYGKPDDILSSKNLCLCHNLTISDIGKSIENRHDILIDNIFVFFTNNKVCKSARKADIERLNRWYKTGIKNCFIFDFTDHPYRLAETLHRDKTLSFIYPGLNEREYQSNKFFTTLNDEEARYIFSPTLECVGESRHWHAEDKELWHELYFKPLIANFTDNADYWVQERNNFSLCLSDELTTAYKNGLRAFTTEIDEHIYDESFTVQNKFAEIIRNEILYHIKEKRVKEIALVVDYYLPKDMKKQLQSIFSEYNVKIYSYSKLRPQRKGNRRILGNSIKEKFVVVLRYRPHNAKSAFSRYPNSFDPFTTNPGQYIIEIIQDYVFIDKYLWDKYEYEMEEYKHFNSMYREEILGGVSKPARPDITRITGDEELDEERPYARQNVATLVINYQDGSSSRIAESEKVIYQPDGGDLDIARLKDLREKSLLDQITDIQRLDEITNVLSQVIIEQEKKDTENEKITRQSCYERGLITEVERDSNVYLWKILLKKKVELSSIENVYSEIMEPLEESRRIQFGAFTNWVDEGNTMMLPLQKTLQKRLMNYLGLSDAYLYVMRSKKRAEIQRTRKNNAMLENFLADYLLTDIDEEAFEQFKDSPINEILQFERIEDLNALIEILNDDIKLKTIKSITI